MLDLTLISVVSIPLVMHVIKIDAPSMNSGTIVVLRAEE